MRLNNNDEIGIIRQVLKSEITWIILIVGALWGFVATVVLPIQALQLGMQKITEKLDFEAGKYGQFESRLGQVEKESAIILDRLDIKKPK